MGAFLILEYALLPSTGHVRPQSNLRFRGWGLEFGVLQPFRVYAWWVSDLKRVLASCVGFGRWGLRA